MGCSKNLVDSEVLMKQLQRGRYEVFHDSDDTGFDVVIINTCGFIHDAKQESVDMILDYAESKKRGQTGKLYVMGCLSERYMEELEKEIPEVDRYFGKFDLKAIAEELKAELHPGYICERKITTPGHYSYLKISEGCNRSCAFCAIPGMTGKYKSRTIDSLLTETGYLAQKGVKELLLIAQDLSYYGNDIYRENRLAELTEKISETEGIEWIRLHYLYPSKFPFGILPVMRENPKICRYLDIPLQHISDPVLRRMRRKVTRNGSEELIRRVRDEVPGVSLRTTVMTGFPGETEEDFEELKQFVRDARFDRLGVFPYSHEEGTYAFKKYSDDIPEEIKQSRAAEIMEIQQLISADLNSSKIGEVFKVIIDRREGEFYIGRTEFDSPEVDGEVVVSSAEEVGTGRFCDVRITGAEDYDLSGEVIM
jgi:ribosomal protein S12 methylthiotransferase